MSNATLSPKSVAILTAADEMPVVKFSRAMLVAAFDAVKDPADWKAPINADVSQADLAVTMIAIEFFTGTKATVEQLMSNGRMLIHAPGYRLGPCN